MPEGGLSEPTGRRTSRHVICSHDAKRTTADQMGCPAATLDHHVTVAWRVATRLQTRPRYCVAAFRPAPNPPATGVRIMASTDPKGSPCPTPSAFVHRMVRHWGHQIQPQPSPPPVPACHRPRRCPRPSRVARNEHHHKRSHAASHPTLSVGDCSESTQQEVSLALRRSAVDRSRTLDPAGGDDPSGGRRSTRHADPHPL